MFSRDFKLYFNIRNWLSLTWIKIYAFGPQVPAQLVKLSKMLGRMPLLGFEPSNIRNWGSILEIDWV